MFIEGLFPMAQHWKQYPSPPTGKWVNKMWNINTMEYYSAVNRNELLMHAKTCMTLKTIMKNERSQRHKMIYLGCHFNMKCLHKAKL